MFSIRSLNRRISFIKLRGMCGNNHNLIVLEADGTCPICKDVSNKAAEHSVHPTAFGARLRARLANYLFDLSTYLSQSGGG